jgi:hypothetical protein
MISGNESISWEDAWYQRKTLSERFPRLGDLSFNKNVIVDRVVRFFVTGLILRRTLSGILGKDSFDILNIIRGITLGVDDDKV